MVLYSFPTLNVGIGAEILYSFVIIFCSLMVYFGTRELYNLSSYKGLKYFRLAFLFFAIAYFFRLLIQVAVNYFGLHEILEIYPLEAGYLFLFIFIYFSSMSIFYLIYSLLWKTLKDNSKIIYLFHAVAIVISLATIIFDNSWFYIGLNVALLISAGIFVYLSSHNPRFKSKKNRFDRVYILLLIFLVLNIINILVPIFFETVKLLIYLFSLSVFFVILYRVLKKSGD